MLWLRLVAEKKVCPHMASKEEAWLSKHRARESYRKVLDKEPVMVSKSCSLSGKQAHVQRQDSRCYLQAGVSRQHHVLSWVTAADMAV